jgi:predicted alpha/beta hydrolase family esterase
MKHAIILHGAPEKENYYDASKPSESNAHWLPWLQKELIIRDIKADTPEVPRSYEPEWDVWCREVERFDISADTMLVGHSAGGGFWLRYLSEHPDLHVGRVILVGPWLDPDHTFNEDFFVGRFDPELISRTAGLTIFYSDDDSDNVHASLDRIRQEVPGIVWRLFNGYGHFTYENLKRPEFPELLNELLSERIV